MRWTFDNVGTRAAKHVSITFQTKGKICLRPAPEEADEPDEAGHSTAPRLFPRLSRPPAPPRFPMTKTVVSTASHATVGYAQILEHSRRMEDISRNAQRMLESAQLSMRSQPRGEYDPLRLVEAIPPVNREEFYEDWPEDGDTTFLEVSCDFFRHKGDPYTFEAEVVFAGDGELKGVIECTVHAENLTDPVKAKLVVGRVLEPASVLDLARQLVDECSRDRGPRLPQSDT